MKQHFVESTIESRLAEANQALSSEITKIGARYLDILLEGGVVRRSSAASSTCSASSAPREILRAHRRRCRRARPQREELERVARFAGWPSTTSTSPTRSSRRSPSRCVVKQTVLDGLAHAARRFAVAVAVTVSLMFVTVLLAAGMLALEREEHAFGRLVRGLVSRHGAAGREGRARGALRVRRSRC